MVEDFKVLGQLNPAATTLSTLYTVPGATKTVVSTLAVCNQGSDTTFRVSVQVAAEADTPKQYLYYDVALPANNTLMATIGMTLDATDVVKVYAGSSTVSFSLFGTEVTA